MEHISLWHTEISIVSSNQNYRTLLDFSLGRIDVQVAMAALGLDSEEDLFLLMAQAHLPMPRLPTGTTERMVEGLNALAEKVAALMTEDYLEARARRGNATAFRQALDRVPDVEPAEDDRL